MADATNQQPEEGINYLALALAWLVPGLGHMVIGHKARGMVFLVTLHGLFALGLILGGIRAINPPEQPIWRYTQFLSGWPMLVTNYVERKVYEPEYVYVDREHPMTKIEKLYESGRPSLLDDAARPRREAYAKDFIEKHPLFSYHPKIQDIGSVYCGLAGMLNLLVIFDVLLRITGSQRVASEGAAKGELAPAGEAK